MSILAPQVNPGSSPQIGVQTIDASGVYAQLISQIKPDAIALVRAHVQDEAAKNPLLAYTKEFSDGQIAVAILSATARFNAVPPIAAKTTVTSSVGMPLGIFLGLSSIALFETSYMSRLRNEIAASDSQTSVDLTKSDKYLRAMEKFRNIYLEEARRFKISANVQSLKSFVPSLYLFLAFPVPLTL